MMKRREFSLIARAYALALFRASEKAGILEQLESDRATLLAIFDHMPRLGVFLESPRIPTENKHDILAKAFKGRMHPMVLRLLVTMVDRERVTHLGDVLDLLRELIDEQRGIYAAALASAQPLPEPERRQLQTVLERYTGRHLRIRWDVEPGLIGGLVFRYGDVLVDGSLRGGLNELRRRLTGASILKPVPGGLGA